VGGVFLEACMRVSPPFFLKARILTFPRDTIFQLVIGYGGSEKDGFNWLPDLCSCCVGLMHPSIDLL
jgi:hypothetical protein